MIIKESSMTDNVEYGIDSRYTTREEREDDALSLMEARLERMKNLPKEQILKAKLVQLKLKMESYLDNPVDDIKNHFTSFLESYIDSIYSKRSEFAKDINTTPVFLSQVINNHREPTEEFILKLMIHSEKAFKNVCNFHKKIWYQVYFYEKICDTMSRQEKWGPEIEKQVSLNSSLSFS